MVSLEAAARDEMLARKALFLGIKAYEPHLAYMEFWWDYAPDWYEWPDDPHEQLTELDDAELVADFVGTVVGEEVRADCIRLVISEEGIHWRCVVKHTDTQMSTAVIRWELLEK